jgi:hypothetical protein
MRLYFRPHLGVCSLKDRKMSRPAPLAKDYSNRVRIFLIVVTIIFVIFVLVVVLISRFRSSEADSVTRFCMQASPANVVGGSGEAGGLLYFELTLDTNDDTVSYYGQDNGALSAIQSLVIHGPQPPGSSLGPTLFALCGAPNLEQVCDILTIPHVIQGSMNELQPGAQDPNPIILQIRQHPSLYYVEVLTALHPTSPGALRSNFDSICGWP